MILRVNVKKTIRVSVPGVPAARMQAFGEQAIDVMRARIIQGVNIFDAPAAPLSRAYARAKVRMGAAPIRNMKLTGALLESMRVTRAKDGSVRIGFGSRDMYIRAHVNQLREQMFGLSRMDQQRLVREIRSEWQRDLLGAVVVSSVAYGMAALMSQPVDRAEVIYMPARGEMRMAA